MNCYSSCASFPMPRSPSLNHCRLAQDSRDIPSLYLPLLTGCCRRNKYVAYYRNIKHEYEVMNDSHAHEEWWRLYVRVRVCRPKCSARRKLPKHKGHVNTGGEISCIIWLVIAGRKKSCSVQGVWQAFLIGNKTTLVFPGNAGSKHHCGDVSKQAADPPMSDQQEWIEVTTRLWL